MPRGHKGETYDQTYGVERSARIRDKQSRNSHSHTLKGRTYEERYGLEKSLKIKAKLINRKGKTYEQLYGLEKAEEIRRKLKEKQGFNTRRGKTYEEIYGKERAAKLRAGVNGTRRGKTLEEFYGFERGSQLRHSRADSRRGKTYEEFYGTERAKEERAKRLENWEDPEYVRKMIKAWQVSPNASEKKLDLFLQQYFPREFAINVRGEVMTLGRKIPDFVNINGKKKVIELFGDYWHSKKFAEKYGFEYESSKGRIDCFKKLGFDTLIIWEYELNNLKKLKGKILKFNEK